MSKVLLSGLVAGLAVVGAVAAGCGSDTPAAAPSPTPTSSTSTTTSVPVPSTTTTKPSPTTTTTKPSPTAPPCGALAKDSASLPELFYATAKAVHRAACANDAGTLADYLQIQDKSEDLADFRSSSQDFRLLAKTLETEPSVGQGGMTYCGPGGAVAVFPRPLASARSMHVIFWDGSHKPEYANC